MPGTSVDFSFTAPPAGDYPYICTFPGHYIMMKGLLHGDAIAGLIRAPARPPPTGVRSGPTEGLGRTAPPEGICRAVEPPGPVRADRHAESPRRDKRPLAGDGARGFEPPTPRSRTECATRLRYAPFRRELTMRSSPGRPALMDGRGLPRQRVSTATCSDRFGRSWLAKNPTKNRLTFATSSSHVK